MAESKDEILANFQSITGIDDVGEAFSHLQETEWDLMAAIQRVMPQSEDPIASPMENNAITAGLLNDLNHFASSSHGWNSMESAFVPVASTSANAADTDIIDLTSDIDLDSNRKDEKPIIFNIHYEQEVYTITLPATATVGNLRDRIFSSTKVPVCRQALRGWPPAKLREALMPKTKLCNLELSAENELILFDLTEEGYMDQESYENSNDDENYTLNILQEPNAKTISLKFPGDQTILDVKTNVYYITDIPVRHQDWTGWPVACTNSTTLAESGIELTHNLILRSKEKPKNNSKANRSNNSTLHLDTDSSADEFEDASDFNPFEEFFNDVPPVKLPSRHLIPNNTDDEATGSLQFVENYIQRFGDPHPVFYLGSLEDALKEACHKPAKDRKLLAVYLHHGESILTNVFCDRLLKHESVIQTLVQSFIFFGWDLTHESNKNLFLSSISACVGTTASMTVRNMQLDKLPAIMIIGKSRVFGRSTCEVISVIYGNVGLDDLIARLMESVEMYSEHIQDEIQKENERAVRDQVLFEQDMAYEETLQADMAKEAAKQQKEMALAAERQRLESEKAEQDARREAIRLVAEQALPAEPNVSTTEPITKIRLRLPSGEFLERKFFAQNKLEDLLNFATSRGYLVEEFKVISSWPRRDLTQMDVNETLQSLKLCPQETVILEER